MNQKRDDQQDKILDAAQQRFIQYGFKKTAMAEIAGDCDMSAANLYRYFANKRDIGVSVVRRFVEFSRQLSAQTLGDPQASEVEKLRRFVLETLRFNHKVFSEQIHLFELIQFISTEHPGMAKEHMGIKRDFLVQVLAQGVKSGAFKPINPELVGQTLFDGLIKFLVPYFLMLSPLPLERLENQANQVINLFLEGLAA